MTTAGERVKVTQARGFTGSLSGDNGKDLPGRENIDAWLEAKPLMAVRTSSGGADRTPGQAFDSTRLSLVSQNRYHYRQWVALVVGWMIYRPGKTTHQPTTKRCVESIRKVKTLHFEFISVNLYNAYIIHKSPLTTVIRLVRQIAKD